jgi:hypothetical protein
MDLLTEWNQGGSYSVRVDMLRHGTGVTAIKLAQDGTVFDDSEADALFGSSGTDWFFFNPSKDWAFDRRFNEGVG